MTWLLIPVLTVLAYLCGVVGTTLLSWHYLGPVPGAGCGLLAAFVALVLLSWQVER